MPDPPPLTPSTGGMSIDTSALTAGDVIVTTSRGVVAAAIEAVTSGPVSHVMVSVGDSQIVEAIRDGVREITLTDALDGATLAVAFRRTSITSDAVDNTVANLRSAVGDSYNYWGVIRELLTQFSGSTRQVPIATDSFYCSQLILTAFASSGFPLLASGNVTAWPTNIVPTDDFGDSLLEYVGHLIA